MNQHRRFINAAQLTSTLPAKRSYNNTDKKWNDLNKVASIPLSVYYDLKRRGIADDPVALKKWMNDSDNQVFRTRQGVL